MVADRALVCRSFGAPWFAPLESGAAGHCLRFYYHWIGDEPVAHIRHLYPCKTVAEFDADLEYLLRRYRPVGMADLIAAVKRGESLPRNAFVLSFDDGYREMFDVVAPRLLRYGVSATFFVNSAFVDNREMCYLNLASAVVQHIRETGWSRTVARGVRAVFGSGIADASQACSRVLSVRYAERHLLDQVVARLEFDCQEYLKSKRPYLSSEDIRRLIALGFSIGAHSIDHPLYADLTLAEQLRQTTDSVHAIRAAFGLEYGVFAFPHSDANVSRDFFMRLRATNLVDVSFGTAGLLDDTAPNHLQRISLERPCVPAHQIVRYHYARRLARAATGRACIARVW
jgi:peptidoglycan/xylan/chitin deacetylase (PgdA/CDA1 family)